jgi:hypothetical protein
MGRGVDDLRDWYGRGMIETSEPGHVSEREGALRAALDELTPEQRLICIWKKAAIPRKRSRITSGGRSVASLATSVAH